MHCHFDRHTVWGMSTVFIVKEGNTPESKMRPPPNNMPNCHMSGDDIGQYNQENTYYIYRMIYFFNYSVSLLF